MRPALARGEPSVCLSSGGAGRWRAQGPREVASMGTPGGDRRGDPGRQQPHAPARSLSRKISLDARGGEGPREHTQVVPTGQQGRRPRGEGGRGAGGGERTKEPPILSFTRDSPGAAEHPPAHVGPHVPSAAPRVNPTDPHGAPVITHTEEEAGSRSAGEPCLTGDPTPITPSGPQPPRSTPRGVHRGGS